MKNVNLSITIGSVMIFLICSALILINFTVVGSVKEVQADGLNVSSESILHSLEHEQENWVVRTLRITYFPNKRDAKRVDEENDAWPELDEKAGLSLIYRLSQQMAYIDSPMKKNFSDKEEAKVHKAIMQLVVNRIKDNWSVSYKKPTPFQEQRSETLPKEKEKVTEAQKEKDYL